MSAFFNPPRILEQVEPYFSQIEHYERYFANQGEEEQDQQQNANWIEAIEDPGCQAGTQRSHCDPKGPTNIRTNPNAKDHQDGRYRVDDCHKINTP